MVFSDQASGLTGTSPSRLRLGSEGRSPESFVLDLGFPGAQPGQVNCETFRIENTSSASATIAPPIIDDPNVPGIFSIDAGWTSPTTLPAGAELQCTVCVDATDAGQSIPVSSLFRTTRAPATRSSLPADDRLER